MQPAAPRNPRSQGWRTAHSGAFGFLLGLALLKFGNPVILDHMVAAPGNALEFIFQPWPIAWGYSLLVVLLAVGCAFAEWRLPRPRWLLLLPVAWLAWQFIAGLGSIDPRLTWAVLPHFAATAGCLYLGLLVLHKVLDLKWFWLGILSGFLAVLWVGFGQHFGGLEETRRLLQEQPGWEDLPREYRERLEGGRIFATLLYPNTLAGVILLFLPPLVVSVWGMFGRLPFVACGTITGGVLYGGIACLVWSRSKAGWLIALVVAAMVLVDLPLNRRARWVVIALLLIGGLGVFGWRFSGYLQRGATSAGARFDYWRSAMDAFIEHPVLGTGPGTFHRWYAANKPPNAEMARLAHNDYLEQASDSGLAGATAYVVFIAGSMILTRRRLPRGLNLARGVWYGLLGWSLQGLVEFGLYIPAISWSGFTLLGWLLGVTLEPRPGQRENPIDKPLPAL